MSSPTACGRPCPPAAGRASSPLLLDLLDRADPSGETRLPSSLEEAVEGLGRRAWIIVVSDLWSGGEDPLPALRRLRARPHEVSVLCPLDPLELDLGLEGDFLFKDVETGDSLPASVDDVRSTYKKLARERFLRFEVALAAMGVPLALCRTDRPLDESLRLFLERVR